MHFIHKFSSSTSSLEIAADDQVQTNSFVALKRVY